MKKKVLFGVVTFLVPIALLTCATIPVKPLTQSDLPDLKGEWEGYYGGGNFRERIELEIFNENLEGKAAFYGTIPGGTVSFPFYGKIENGRLVYSWSYSGNDNWMKLSFRKGDGKMKLEGEYQIRQWSGTMSLRKVVK
jgi:hypothetical protein